MNRILKLIVATLVTFTVTVCHADTQMPKEYIQMIGRMAYVWGYPIVNSYNRMAGMAYVTSQNGNVPGLNGGVLPMAPVGQLTMLTDYIKPEQTFIACPNQDVVYGAGYFDLEKGPVVFQVPDFGDRFWVYALYDARTDEFGKIGKPYNTKPGFYMMVGPNWKGKIPEGISGVMHSSTNMAFAAPRVFKSDDPSDTKAVSLLVNQIMFYPLSEFNHKMKTIDWSKLPSFPMGETKGGETKWVEPEKYFDQLREAMKHVPPLSGEEALYQWIGSVFKLAENDAEVKKILVESFIAADKDLIEPLFQWKYNGSEVGNGWNSVKNNAEWGFDYYNRTATSKSNIYENVPTETKYFYRDLDDSQQQLHGKNIYTITFSKEQIPPVNGFWSITLYNKYHLFAANSLNRYSLGTKNKSLKYNNDGSLTLYFSAKSPGKDKESNWIPAPNDAFSLYLRAYGPDKAIIDGTWTPPNINHKKGSDYEKVE